MEFNHASKSPKECTVILATMLEGSNLSIQSLTTEIVELVSQGIAYVTCVLLTTLGDDY